ncbi:MAG: hypothetical protein ACRC8S_20940 [Fimbriiglobus sp.]
MQKRYDDAVLAAQTRVVESIVSEFEAEYGKSRVVICCDFEQKLLPVARGDRDLFANYYDMLELLFLREPDPTKPDWHILRGHFELELFRDRAVGSQVHYGCLSIDGHGLPHYGNCEVLLRDDMITHRTMVFEENSAQHFQQHGKILSGKKCSWPNRAKLMVAKLADRVDSAMKPADFPRLVLQVGPKGDGSDDQFVEAIIYGELTFHAFERIVYYPSRKTKAQGDFPRPKRGSSQAKRLAKFCAETFTKGSAVEFVER